MGWHEIKVWCVGPVGTLSRLPMIIIVAVSVGVVTASVASVLRVIARHLIVRLNHRAWQRVGAIGIRRLLLRLMVVVSVAVLAWPNW